MNVFFKFIDNYKQLFSSTRHIVLKITRVWPSSRIMILLCTNGISSGRKQTCWAFFITVKTDYRSVEDRFDFATYPSEYPQQNMYGTNIWDFTRGTTIKLDITVWQQTSLQRLYFKGNEREAVANIVWERCEARPKYIIIMILITNALPLRGPLSNVLINFLLQVNSAFVSPYVANFLDIIQLNNSISMRYSFAKQLADTPSNWVRIVSLSHVMAHRQTITWTNVDLDQLDSWEQTQVKFESQYNIFHSRKWFWKKKRQRISDHFVKARRVGVKL